MTKGNGIPVTDRGGLLGRETSKPPHFLDNRLIDGAEVVNLYARNNVSSALLVMRFVFITILDIIHRPEFYLKTRHFGDWILFSGGTYSGGSHRKFVFRHREERLVLSIARMSKIMIVIYFYRRVPHLAAMLSVTTALPTS
jgi:hypothetical protein